MMLSYPLRIVGLAAFLIPSLCFSQDIIKIPETPSANAMNLGLFGEVPVSLFGGLPSVTVPIYEIKAKDISVPISLDYHASGVRPEVHPSWVGMGWSMTCGGSITREIKGRPDEAKCLDGGQGCVQQAGYYFYKGAQNARSDWADDAYLKDYRWVSLYIDYEPDLFQFSFPGHSGVFFIDQNGQWRVQSDKSLKVIFEDNDFIDPFFNAAASWHATKTFNKFTIIDELGVQYVFGTANAIEYSDELISPPNTPEERYQAWATSWFLSKIISADGRDIIDFTYERGPYQAAIYKTINNERVCSNFTSFLFHTSGKLISPVYLSTVTYAKTGLTVSFGMDKSNELGYKDIDFVNLFTDAGRANISELPRYYGDIPYFTQNPPANPSLEQWKWGLVWLKLNTINIADNIQPLKTILLYYDNTPSERLRLSKVDVKKSFYEPSPDYSYGFEYYNNYSLPDYLTTLGDNWGFYNDSPLNVLNTYEAAGFFNLKRPTDLAHAVNGTIKSITYPTKAKSTIEYEQHRFSTMVDNDSRTLTDFAGVAGGLRVKRITTDDNNGNAEVKDYYYVDNYSPGADVTTLPSSGILEAVPKYSYGATLLDNEGNSFSFDFFSSNLVVPTTSSSSGQHISYSTVVERRGDGAYTIYKYTNHNHNTSASGVPLYHDGVAVNSFNTGMLPYVPYSSRGFERGRLLQKTVYDNNANALQSETYEYQRPLASDSYVDDNYSARAIQQNFKNNCLNSATRTSVSRTAYRLYYYPFTVKSITYWNRGNISSADELTVAKTFTYNLQGLITSEASNNSKGEQIKTEYDYAYNQQSGMRTKNMLDYKSRTEVFNGTQSLSRKMEDYATWPDDPGNFFPKTEKVRSRLTDPEDVVMQYDAYDNGNIKQRTPKSGVTESFEWGYNKTLPIAKVVNAQNSYTDYFVALPQSGTMPATTSSTSVNFTNYFTSDVTLTLRVTGPPTASFSISTKLTKTGFQQNTILCLPFGTDGCGPGNPTTITYPNVPPGTYTLTVFSLQQASANIDYTYAGRQEIVSGIKEFYFNNFEEGFGTSVNPHTGTYCYNGASYNLVWARPTTRDYVYSYWYRTGGIWKYSGELPYVSLPPHYDNVVLNNGDAYDDIMIYPKDGRMSSYTYNPSMGMTSMIDERGQTTYYEYDGAQRLQDVKDQDKNIVQSLRYNFKQ